MVYVTQAWVDGAGGGTPVNAARLAHIEAGLGDHETRVTALETDTGWIDIAVRAGFAAISTAEKPQARRVGKLIKLRGGFANTGLTASASFLVADLPAGITAPPQIAHWPIAASAAAAIGTVIIGTDKTITLRTNATIPSYYKLDSVNWFID